MWTGERIKALRKSYDETQAEFSRRIGVSIQALRVWEQDQGHPLGPTCILLGILEEGIRDKGLQPVE